MLTYNTSVLNPDLLMTVYFRFIYGKYSKDILTRISG